MTDYYSMKRPILGFIMLFLISTVCHAQGRTAVGQEETAPEFHIDTVLL